MDNSTNPANDKRRNRPNGQGSVSLRKDGRWQAQYTAQTPKGRKRRTIYRKTEREAYEALYQALGWWDEDDYTPAYAGTESVYFIQCAHGGPVKIGRATDVDRRFKAIQSCCPYPLRLIHVIVGAGSKIEAQLHRRFRAYRLHSEWYDNGKELMDYIFDLRRRDLNSQSAHEITVSDSNLQPRDST